MANHNMPNFITSNFLIVFLVWFFTHSLVATQKMDAKIDICIILTPVLPTAGDNINDPMAKAALQLTQFFEMGDEKARFALVKAVSLKETRHQDRMLINLTGSEEEFKSKLDQWAKERIAVRDGWYDFDLAFDSIRARGFSDSGADRAKAVLFVIPFNDGVFSGNDEQKKVVLPMAKALRDSGVWIYVMAQRADTSLANGIAGGDDRWTSPHEIAGRNDLAYFLNNDVKYIKTAIFNDLCRWEYYCEWDYEEGNATEDYIHPYVNDAKDLCDKWEPKPALPNNCTAKPTTSSSSTTTSSFVFFLTLSLGVIGSFASTLLWVQLDDELLKQQHQRPLKQRGLKKKNLLHVKQRPELEPPLEKERSAWQATISCSNT